MKNKNNSLVSIIIPTYKRPLMLDRAIESALSQTYYNLEIIVVDDNDENSNFRRETELCMAKYKKKKKVRYIKHRKNLGGSLARNTGIKQSNGKYITFLDDDDEYSPDKVEKQIKKFNESTIENVLSLD